METTQLARHDGALVAPPSVSASSSSCKPIKEEANEQDKLPAEPATDPPAIVLATFRANVKEFRAPSNAPAVMISPDEVPALPSVVASPSAGAPVENSFPARRDAALVAQQSVPAEPAAVLALPHEAVEEEIHLDDTDRTSIVGSCAILACYTSEEQAMVSELTRGFFAKHATGDIVVDRVEDSISCIRCKLKRSSVKKNGNKFRASPCPEESSTSKRATWITSVCNITKPDQATSLRWCLARLAETERGHAGGRN